ncbi:MAG: hypothetical protein WA659_06975 [Candidatus Aquirickettsiella sp.]
MPIKTDVTLNIDTKNYKLLDNRSITVCDIKSPEDPNFYFQLRFIQKSSQKIDLNQLESALKNRIKKLDVNNALYFDKKEFLISLGKLGFNIESTAIIEKNKEKSSKALFKLDQKKLITSYDKNLLDLFILKSIDKDGKTYYLSYEIPKDITGNNSPICSISIFFNKSLEKIYLFPTKSFELEDVIKNLNIPYVKNSDPFSNNKSHNEEIQTRINLQTTISEILTHLEKPKYFRKNGSDKVDIFKNLSKMISENKSLTAIKTQLDSFNTLQVLSKHRDPWGFFAFFKGETYSAIAWKELGKIIPESTQSATVDLSSSLSNY